METRGRGWVQGYRPGRCLTEQTGHMSDTAKNSGADEVEVTLFEVMFVV